MIELRPIVVINKIDRPEARCDRGRGRGLRPFRKTRSARGAARFSDPLRLREAGLDVDRTRRARTKTWRRCSTWCLSMCRPPKAEDGPFRMLATTIEADPFLGRILTGRISNGIVKPNMTVKAISRDGKLIEQGRVSKVLGFRGLERAADRRRRGRRHRRHRRAHQGHRGGYDLRSASDRGATRSAHRPPTLTMTFRINDGPLAGQEGDKVQSRVIRDRLLREAQGNVALRILKRRRTATVSRCRAVASCSSVF